MLKRIFFLCPLTNDGAFLLDKSVFCHLSFGNQAPRSLFSLCHCDVRAVLFLDQFIQGAQSLPAQLVVKEEDRKLFM